MLAPLVSLGYETGVRAPFPFAARCAAATTSATFAAAISVACSPVPRADGGGVVDGGADFDAGVAAPTSCAALPPGVVAGSVGALNPAVGPGRRRIVLMGGGPEVDRASILFAQSASGGDVLVLRATGSVDSYTSYFAAELAIVPPPASVTTWRIDDVADADDDAVLCGVAGAEALWLAGGDQSDYLIAWPDALHAAIAGTGPRGAAIGGTSAGAMSWSGLAFDAHAGGTTSAEALAAPDADAVSVTFSPFAAAELADTLVDTHFVARDREGRMLSFLGRAIVEGMADAPRGLGLDEGAAIVIEGDAFRVLADDGATVRVYEAAGPAAIDGPLDLAAARRVILADGDEGAWPIDLDAFSIATLSVSDGVITGP